MRRGFLGILIFVLCVPAGLGAQGKGLRAGAARLDITPPSDAALQMSGYGGRTGGFTKIHDPLHVRTIVVDDGSRQAALVSCETLYFPQPVWEEISNEVASAAAIPRENLMLAGVHTHGAPALALPSGPLTGKQAEYLASLKKAVVASVLQAKSSLQPANIGFGTGKAHVNTNRRASDGEGGWMLGNNPEGVSDKTVAVIRIDSVAGEPIAIFSNYGVHGTVLGGGNLQVSADLPGATATFVERHYGGKVVSPWTSGTAGDQDPIYRVGTDFQNVTALGRLLGEEVVRVADTIKTGPGGRLHTMQTVVTCPGKRTVQAPGAGREYKFEDAAPVPIRLSMLVIGDVALAGISGEVLTNIGLRIKRESPFSRTIIVTQCNGASGYLPDDAAYDRVSYEIQASRVKPGCAEDAITRGLLQMMRSLFE